MLRLLSIACILLLPPVAAADEHQREDPVEAVRQCRDEELEAAFCILEKALARVAEERELPC